VAAPAAAAPAAVSGLRSGCQLLVHVDVAGAMADGVRFWTSANGVVLAATLPLRHVTAVEDLTRGGVVIFRDGALVAEGV
jgi:RNA:NAD 2'-phosphotransferase (TPT1/KptA family)